MKIIKLIIDDVVVEKEMTVDEVFKQFDNMLKKFASECVFKSKTMHNNILGFEDFYGEGCIKLVESYNAYRPILPSMSFKKLPSSNSTSKLTKLLCTFLLPVCIILNNSPLLAFKLFCKYEEKVSIGL